MTLPRVTLPRIHCLGSLDALTLPRALLTNTTDNRRKTNGSSNGSDGFYLWDNIKHSLLDYDEEGL